MQINEIYRDIVVVLYLNINKDIRGLKYIIIILFTLFWIFYVAPAILLRIPYIQQKVANIATTELSEYLSVPVKIGNVDIEWFNRLVLEDLYLEGQNGDVLFTANHVSAGIEMLPLAKGKLVFSAVRLFGFSVNLNKAAPKEKLNLQFVLDAFASKDSIKKNPNIDLRFNSILIRRGNFRYDIKNAPYTPNKFNAKHVHVKNLSAKIAIKALNKDSINATIKKMSFEETSGFSLNKISLNVIANKDSTIIQDFEVKLPNTNLKIAHAHLQTEKTDSLSTLLEQSPIAITIAPSQIGLKDLSAFVPAFKNFTETVELSAEASGRINDINLKHLTLKYSDEMLFIGKMGLQNITKPQEAYISGQVNKMYVTTEGLSGLVNNFSPNPVQLPPTISNLGTINFTGEVSGFFNHLEAFGKLSSTIGSIETNLIVKQNKEKNISHITGSLSTSHLHLKELFSEGTPLGTTKLNINLDTQLSKEGSFTGNIKANINEFEFKGYKYENILLSGDFQKNGFNGVLNINDPNGELYAKGLFLNQGENSVFNFTSRLNHFRPDSLHLTNKYESPEISCVLNANFTGNNIDNAEGDIQLDSLSFYTTPDSFFIKQLKIEATGHSSDRHLQITSDILNGEVTGAYSFTTIVPSFMKTLENYIPALINTTQKKRPIKENNFSLLLTIENTEAISNTLKLPFTMLNQGRITGHYNNQYDRFRLEAYLPKFNIGKTMFESGYLTCDNPQDKVNLLLKATQYNVKGLRNYLSLNSNAKENQINTQIEWANNKERLFKADLSASTLFIEEKQEKGRPQLRTEISLNESPLILNDSIWRIAPANIQIANGRIGIQDFSITNGNEYLYMDGNISKDPTDTLLLDLKQIELSYIFDILNIPVLQFAGKATGTFNITDLYGSRILNTNLEVQNFAFNQVNLGRLNLFSEWDDQQKGILMLGSIYKNDSTWTDVNGYIYPVGKDAGLSLHFGANDINLAFLHPFVENIAQNMQGQGFGNVHLYGPFSKLNIEGDAYVQNGGLGIEFLNTYYTFSDSVHLRPNAIIGQNVTVYDKFGNPAKVNLIVNHQNFKDVSFDVNIQANNTLVYDAPQKQNPLIYGTVFGTGTASIKGNTQVINFDINMQSSPKTDIKLDFMNNSTAEDYDFITFINKKELQEIAQSQPVDSIKPLIFKEENEGAEMRMNFLLDITPEANIDLIMDPVAGDKIAGNCNGSLQIQYGTKSDLRMYGNVGIVEGNYNFSLQQLIHKNFKIREGSTINFRGDPFEATMNINAIYNVTANIQDLDASLAEESARRNIPVNCVLNLDGVLRNPTISFDLELPGSNEELERRVKSLINTDDMITKQIIYLLVLNKFYTPEYINNQYKSNDFSAVASSALSSQISSLMNSFTDKVQLGTNIRTSQDGIEDTEVEMLLSSQLLNNRLIFNGNFGYKNNALQKNAFIGEFDLEYLLTPSGDIRLKAYNHANDMYMFLKQALTTQGVGIMYKKDFTRFSDIFRRRKKYSLINTPDSLFTTPIEKAKEVPQITNK